MNAFFKPIINDKIIFLGFSVSFFLILVAIIYTILTYQQLPPIIPLFNQLPWGEQRLGDKFQVFLPIILALSLNLLNMFLTTYAYNKIPLISRILSTTSFLICILTLLFIIRTIRIVI